jgi:hypothetical protein
MHREIASNISYQSNKWFPTRTADNEIESIRNVYVYILSMISIIYHITLYLGNASHLDTAEQLTAHLGRLADRACHEPRDGER